MILHLSTLPIGHSYLHSSQPCATQKRPLSAALSRSSTPSWVKQYNTASGAVSYSPTTRTTLQNRRGWYAKYRTRCTMPQVRGTKCGYSKSHDRHFSTQEVTADADSQHGDLSISPTSKTNPILHSIIVEDSVLQNVVKEQSAVSMESRLELGVSELGIIGRTVSIVRNGHRVGEGVIGWN